MVKNILVGVFCTMLFAFKVHAAQLRVNISNISSNEGMILCSVYTSPDNFLGKGVMQRQEDADSSGGVICMFDKLELGSYAVAVLHDENTNGKNYRNYFGMPTEDWGVSNNIRPTMRAPTFEEARFQIYDSITIEIRVD